MINTRKIARVGALLLVLCLVSATMMAGTFAKYTSAYAGQDTALVARWDFKVSDGTTNLGEGTTPTQALDLFSHLYNVNINQKLGEGATADYIIAPGVKDDFTVKMTFLSDVDATVTVDFAKAGTVADNLPIEYLVVDTANPDGAQWVSLANLEDTFVAQLVENNSAALADVDENTFTFKKSAADASAVTTITQTVKWRWAFDTAEQTTEGHDAALASNDTTDTTLGETSALGGATRTSYILNVTVTAEQLAPGITP